MLSIETMEFLTWLVEDNMKLPHLIWDEYWEEVIHQLYAKKEGWV